MTIEPKRPATFFDSPERTPDGIVSSIATDVAHAPLVGDMLEAFPSPTVILDANRQILAVNGRALAAFEVMSPFDVHGLRLGEALGCICSERTEGGCGTSRHCAECGAAHAIRGAKSGTQTVRECRITTATADGRERAWDFRAIATPMRIAGCDVIVVALEDVADEKRRQTLERMFFHDLLGAATAVHGLAHLVAASDEARAKDAVQPLVHAAAQLLEEIQAQRDLMLAERGQLTMRVETVSMNEIVRAVHQQYRLSALAEGREVVCTEAGNDGRLLTDRVQLVRSLGNLVRNALEAAGEGERVGISAETMADGALFQVSNPGEMPPHVQLQIFQRSFSTKDAHGRGIGTYSVKLIVEQYLKGRVSFVSSPETGTVFSIWLPAEVTSAE